MTPRVTIESQALEELSKYPGILESARNISIEAGATFLAEKFEPDTDNLGGESPLWNRVKREIYILVCTEDPRYADVRARANQAGSVFSSVGLPGIAVAISSKFGVECALVTPFAALAVLAIARLGQNTWCALYGNGDVSFGDQKLPPSEPNQK